MSSQRYLLRPEAGAVGDRLRVLLVDAIVVPALGHFDKPHRSAILSVQRSRATGSPDSVLASLAWLALFAAGLWSIVRRRGGSRVERVSVALAIGQLTLHLLYGTETFLYVLNVLPWLILIASASVEAVAFRWRPFVVAVTVFTISLAAFGNVSRWHDARAWFVADEFARGVRSSSSASNSSTYGDP